MATPRKRFGQHWLQNDRILQQLVEAADLQPGDRLLEIGPGTGNLTQRMLPLVERLIAVEIDRDLCCKLIKKFQTAANFLLLEADFLDLDLAQVLSPEAHGQLGQPHERLPNKVVANIPYYITGPILEKLLGTISQPNPYPYDSIVLLVQKEVGDRITTDPGSKDMGALTVRVQYLAQCDLVCPVPAKAFYPPPKVDSAVVRITPRPFSLQVHDPRRMETLVKVGFSAKRKMLRNNLKSLVDGDRLLATFTELGISPQSRAEDLSVEQWVKLSDRLPTQI
jgi:16S rRNA (adenine1518-N6/adenine1519-N6)-dimethyltransferase